MIELSKDFKILQYINLFPTLKTFQFTILENSIFICFVLLKVCLILFTRWTHIFFIECNLEKLSKF